MGSLGVARRLPLNGGAAAKRLRVLNRRYGSVVHGSLMLNMRHGEGYPTGERQRPLWQAAL